MKNLKYLLFVAAVAFAIVGCRKPVDVSFAVATQEMEAAGGSVEVALNSNGEWTIESTAEWLTVSPMSGSGNATLTLTAQANATEDSRSAQIKAITKDNAATMNLTQNALEYYLTVSPKVIQCGSNGGEFTVSVSSNVDWEVGLPQWISSTVTHGSDNATVTLTVMPIDGEMADSREADVFFGNSSYGDKVHVIQTVDPILSIDVRPKNLEFVSAGETKSVFVFTEDSWSATVDVDWVTLSKTEGQGNGEVSVTLGENPEYVQRQTTVVFTSGGNMTAFLSISQEALPDPHFLEVSPLSFQFGNEGGEQSMTIGCDDAWTIDASNDWLTVTPMTGTGNATVTIGVNPNTLLEPRMAYVIVKSGDLVQEVMVNQAAGDTPLFVGFEPDTLYVSYSGGIQHLELTSNTTWQLQASEWINLLNTTTGEGDASFDIVVDFNENSEDRIGYVNAKHNGQILATMIIVQEGWYSILEASLTEIEARPEGGEYVIQVTANQSWSVNTTENWIHCTPNSGFSNGEFTITVDAMEGVRPRMGRIKLGGSTGDQVMIMVNQHP